MSTLLTPELLSNIGKSAPPKKELVTRRDIRKYSIAAGHRQEKFLAGDEAPPMFHIALFWGVVEMEQLSPDGVSMDSLLPEFPLKRAMAGGWKIDYHRPIFPGDVLVAKRTLTAIYEKKGSQGPLIFYEITTQVESESGETILTEKITRILR
ncbi:MAG: MaoC family dehydratase N-terminal domain-containing protein [Proteobacteria bacterium]|nr:MaoC family dehydratase N-terminal domain-containing protein [Pseudomonadota bacterium]